MTRGHDPSLPQWIGVDFDGTLATQGSLDHTGSPVEPMMQRVRQWLAEGREVRILTARACLPEQTAIVQDWLEKHGLPRLSVTNSKDFNMDVLWDDRCVSVEPNTGRINGGAQDSKPSLFPLMTKPTNPVPNPLDGTRLWDNS